MNVALKRARTKRSQPKDPALPIVRGVITCKVFCISMPPHEMDAIDATAARLGMNRSQFLRESAKALIASTLAEKAERDVEASLGTASPVSADDVDDVNA